MKEVNEFQKNFLHLLKFFINNFKISEQELLEEVGRLKDNEPLVIYIKKYYEKSIELIDEFERTSRTFTFGRKS
jgi:aminopeptidase-like protein